MLISRVQNDAIVIPQRATFEVLQKRYVYVVDEDNVAHQREIAYEEKDWTTCLSSRAGLAWRTRSFSRGSGRFATATRWNARIVNRSKLSQTSNTTRNSSRSPVLKYGKHLDSLRTMFSQFLRRPALAIVISIIILFLGGLSIKTLPISQFPNVAPPSVVVTLAYPGASAQVLVDSVLVILEQAINGVADMRYMVSAGTSAGEATILIIFEPGTDPNVAS